jgi:hypothetical protein
MDRTSKTACKKLVIEFNVKPGDVRHNQLQGEDHSIYHIYPNLSSWGSQEIPDENNPRSHDENVLKKSVAKEIFKTLRGEEGAKPEDFHLINRGCTIFADSIEYDKNSNRCKIILTDYKGDGCPHGMVDGATTHSVVRAFREETISELETDGRSIMDSALMGIRVHIEVIIGLDKRDRSDIGDFSKGRNTSIQVKNWSIADFIGEFDWLKDKLKKFESIIGYEENDNREVTVLEIIAILNLFNPHYGLGNEGSKSSPTCSYNGKAGLVRHFGKTSVFEGFESMENILFDILELHDYVISKYQDTYKAITGKGKLFALTGHTQKKLFKDLGTAKIHHRKLNFSSYTTNIKSVPTSLLYPLLGSMRCLLVKEKGGKIKWSHGIDPRDFFNENGSKLMEAAFKCFYDMGGNMNAYGKSSISYDHLYSMALNCRKR